MGAEKPTYKELEKKVQNLEIQLERTIHAQADYHLEILDILNEPAAMIDTKYRFVYVNRACCDIFQMDHKELKGRTLEELVGSNKFEEVVKPCLNQCLGGERVFTRQSIEFDAGSGIRHLLISYWPHYNRKGLVDGVLAIADDVTEREEKNETYEKIIQTAIDGFWLVDTSGRILEANSSASAMLGYSVDEMRHLSINDIDCRESHEDTQLRIRSLVEKGTDVFETRHRRKDGSELDVEISVSYLQHRGGQILVFIRDISRRKLHGSEREAMLKLLSQIHQSDDLHQFMAEVTRLMQDWSGCEAVGIRLQEGEDYPYFETRGFPTKFVKMENSLCETDARGHYVCDAKGKPVLECMCGNVMRGRADDSQPFFTNYGSFWTNSTTQLLASSSEADRQARTRNRCHGEGYESVALIPLRYRKKTLGLLQFNDPQKGRFDEKRIHFLERLAVSLSLGIVQHQTSEDLKESEKQFRSLYENAPVGIFQTTKEGKPLLINRTMAHILGFGNPDEVIAYYSDLGKQLYVNPKDRVRFLHLLQKCGSVENFEYLARTKNGSHVWLSVNARLMNNHRGASIYIEGFTSDISARKKAEKQLLKQESLQRAMISNISDVLTILDKEGMIQYKSPNIKKQFGWDPEDLIGLSAWETVHPDDIPWLKQEFQKVLQNKNESATVEYYYKCKDNTYKPIELTAVNLLHDPDIEGVLLNYRDISERKEAENEIKLNEARLDALVQLNEMTKETEQSVCHFTLNKAIELTSSHIGFLGFLNEEETKVTIYDWSEATKKDCQIKDMKFEFDVQESGIWGEVIRRRKPLVLNDFESFHPLKRGLPQGHVNIQNYLSIPVFSDDKIVAVIAVANKDSNYSNNDIKQLKLLMDGMQKFFLRKKGREMLRTAKLKAEESDRLKSAFLANMSHEIRTPMNSIMGFSQLLLERDYPPAKQKKFLNVINSHTKHLLEIINDIVDISKIEANQLKLTPRSFNLNDLLQEMFKIYQNELKHHVEKHIELKIHMPMEKNKSYMVSDDVRLRQIMHNLLSNAMKFTRAGTIEFGYEVNDECSLHFFVRDTGIGIPQDKKEYVFQRFRQADDSSARTHEGTGLGLTISKNLVELLGGKIWVDSTEGKGSQFSFTLPYKPEWIGKTEKTSEPQGDCHWPDKTLLIVEDDPTSLEFIMEILDATGAKLVSTKTGGEALKAFENNASLDLILLDIRLPDIGGLEIAKTIREKNDAVPIIAQTAHAMGDDREKCIRAGATDYIAKPINANDLLDMIQKYL